MIKKIFSNKKESGISPNQALIKIYKILERFEPAAKRKILLND